MFWWLVLSAIATLGGWTAIARQYRAAGPPTGQSFWFQSARFGWCDYNGCLVIRIADEGVRLSLPFPFRPGHPPIFLPWSALNVVDICDRWYGRYVSMNVGSPKVARIRLPLKIMEAAGQLNKS